MSGRAEFDSANFYLPLKAIDPWGGESSVTWDSYNLLPISATDPVGNVVQSSNDYRVLAPYLVTDPNLNRSEVEFDALGMVVATAVMGKDDGANEGDVITDPTTRLEYDLLAYQDRQEPAFVKTIAREKHGSANPRFQESYAYSDGFGRVIQQKVQAEEGDAPLRDGNGDLQRDGNDDLIIGNVTERWVGTGRTIFNNKGNPVKQYEPFFSSTSDYEPEKDLVDWGVTPVITYDSIDRVVRTDLPDGTFTKVEFDSWEQLTFDQNDTVLESQWYQDRGAPSATGSEPSDPDERAAWLSAQHADTPTKVILDSLGRPFLSVAHNRTGTGGSAVDAFYRTRTVLDIEGNTLAIYDAKQHSTAAGSDALNPSGTYTNITQTFDVLGRRQLVDSPDAGKRLSIADIGGKPLRAYNSRGFVSRAKFDAAQRLTHSFVDDGTSEILIARMSYGESLDTGTFNTDPNTPSAAQALNLRGQVHLAFDTAGKVKTESVDFKGNILSASRALAEAYKTTPDWGALDTVTDPAVLETTADPLLALEPGTSNVEAFTTATEYDALNRVVSSTTPDGSISTPSYNEANLLEESSVDVRGGGTVTRVVFGLDYNARGQRLVASHNDTGTDAPSHTLSYQYDPENFRVTEIRATRPAAGARDVLQHLRYTYDAVGNITEKRDDATWDGDLMSALDGGNAKYTYDALYRLTRATGREHAGQQQADADPPEGAVPHGNDLSGMRDYVEETTYDELGNITEMRHLTGVSNSETWSRNYNYATDSNRLLATSIPTDLAGQYSAAYTHDVHGSMTSMPHLSTMEWDFADRLQHVERAAGQDAYYTYDASGQRVRKVYEHGPVEERIYLGGVEIYRKRAAAITDSVDVERETLHVNDDTRRVAMVETLTIDVPGNEPTNVGDSRWRYQLDNHLGSSAMEIDGDATAQVISYEEFHPYGSTAFRLSSASSEVSAKRYRYTGKEKDEESGLYYHGARYYAPWLGRWTAADPAGLVDGLNLFRYSRDNPIRFNDPSGTETNDCDESVSSCGVSKTVVSNEEKQRMSHPVLHKADQANLENAAALEALRELPPLTEAQIEQGRADFERNVDEALQKIDPTKERAEKLVAQAEAKRQAEFQEELQAERELQEKLPDDGGEFVPVFGAGRESLVYFQNGAPIRGTLSLGLAVSDVFLVKSLAVGGGRLLLRTSGKEGAESLADEAVEAVSKGVDDVSETVGGGVNTGAGAADDAAATAANNCAFCVGADNSAAPLTSSGAGEVAGLVEGNLELAETAVLFERLGLGSQVSEAFASSAALRQGIAASGSRRAGAFFLPPVNSGRIGHIVSARSTPLGTFFFDPQMRGLGRFLPRRAIPGQQAGDTFGFFAF